MPKQHHVTPILKLLHWLKSLSKSTSKSYHWPIAPYTIPSLSISANSSSPMQPAPANSPPPHPLRYVLIFGHSSSQVLQLSHVCHCTTTEKWPPPEFYWFSVTSSSLSFALHHLLPPNRFPLMSHLNSYPKSSDPCLTILDPNNTSIVCCKSNAGFLQKQTSLKLIQYNEICSTCSKRNWCSITCRLEGYLLNRETAAAAEHELILRKDLVSP